MSNQFRAFSSSTLPKRHLGNRRILRVTIGGGAIATAIGLLTAEPFFSTATASRAGVNASLSANRATVADPAPATLGIVPASVIEADPKFFFGTGDNSAGFYAERPAP